MAAGPLRNLSYPDFTLCSSLVSSTSFSALSRSLLCPAHQLDLGLEFCLKYCPLAREASSPHHTTGRTSYQLFSAPANLCVCSQYPLTASGEACCSFVSFQKDGRCIAKLVWLMIFLLHKEREREDRGSAIPMGSVRRRWRGKTLTRSQCLELMESFSKTC